ncbi:hypothetical protein OPIT5_14715 [Opitutaceae bacterium TAV5]|nr:hypothetical protein OPIT5_14715 [Opitutaceae bacterium TAV5]
MKAKYLFSLLLPAISLCAPLARGALVFEDDFSSGVGNWSTTSTAFAFAATNTAGPASGNPAGAFSRTGAGDSSDTRHAAYASFAPVTLRAGETITLSFDYKGIEYGANTGNYFVFGLANSNGTAPVTDDKGYLSGIRADSRPTAAQPSVQSVGTRYYQYKAGLVAAMGDGYLGDGTRTGSTFYLSGESGIALPDGTATRATDGYIDDVFHFSLSITREANGDLTLLSTFLNKTLSTEANPVSFTSTIVISAEDVTTYTLDTINIGESRRGTYFAVDNVLVDYQAIPEPATVATLLGLGALLACAFLRQRR